MRRIILGTDWWSDCDDAVALRLICRAAKDERVRLLGIGINACMEYSVASVKGFLKAEGLCGVPIGIDLEATDYSGALLYQKGLAESYCPNVSNRDAEDAVRLYRRLLAAEDGKVEILEIGFLQVVANLLKSGADDISDKSGLELVREKVSKLWVMAGKWDIDGGREHNFCLAPRSRVAAKEFCELCPVPVTFLGFEVGYGVITGGRLDKRDHLYKVLCDHGSEIGRHSWDPMLALMALIGDEAAAGYSTVVGTASVDEETGANHFVPNSRGMHSYVIKERENRYYEDRINALI